MSDLIGENPILMTDSYKETHWKMYPPNLKYLTSYLEARAGGEYSSSVFFGLQYLLAKRFSGPIVKAMHIPDAEAVLKSHFRRDDVFNLDGWEHIVRDHQGRLPVYIRAVPEGMRVPESTPLLTIENTCPRCAWVVNHLETLLVQLYYPITVATISAAQKRVIVDGMGRSANSMAKVPYMLHDFGYRGGTSVESAAIGGAAHLINFLGTDTLAALELLRYYYDDGAGKVAGYSVPAAEHSTITSWGEQDEEMAYRHILQSFPSGVVSVVSDSYDVYEACRHMWGGGLAPMVMAGRKTGRTLVIRPDSGDPHEVVPACLDILGERFGFTLNGKGYKVLPSFISLIQGDGISRHTLSRLVETILARGWSLENLVFGSGGGLIQAGIDRDTLKFAMKCSAVKRGNDPGWRASYKRPVGDPGKNSKRGYLHVTPEFKTVNSMVEAGYSLDQDVLEPVFLDGELLRRYSLADVRVNRGWSDS